MEKSRKEIEKEKMAGSSGGECTDAVMTTLDLSIGYVSGKKKTVIARDLNLCIEDSTVVCLLGQNGIGKSTLLRTLSTMQPELGGEIRLENTPILSMTRNELAKKIGLVLTERIPESNLTVGEMVALGRQPYTNWIGKLSDDDKNLVSRALEDAQLESLKDTRCDELSDGQLQRAMICRAVAQNTKLIFLDEPTAHLDIQHKIETFQLLKKLAHEMGRSILISTHEVQLATQMADMLWLMNSEGIISGSPEFLIQEGKINELFDRNTIHFDKETRQFRFK